MSNPKNAAARPPYPPQFQLSVSPGASQQFDMWRWAVSPMFDIELRQPEDRSTFGLAVIGHHFADMAISKTRSAASIFNRSTSVIARSGLDNVLLQVYLRGGYQLDAESRQIEVEPGDIAVFLLDRPGAIVADAYTNISLVLPRKLLSPLIADFDRLHGLVLRNGTSFNALLKSHLQVLHAQAGRISMDEAGSVARGTASLVAACIGSPRNDGDAESLSMASLQMIRQAIENNLSDMHLGPALLSQRFGMSRATLYRLFEPLGGVSNYIQRRRLLAAYRMISNPSYSHERIGTIARRFGFSNDTAFSRAFREMYLVSPREMRAAAQAGSLDALQPRGSADASFDTLNRWLLGLETSGR